MKSPMSFRGKPRSLRMRLLLWYGTLLAVALGLFAVLILVLTMNAIEQNVDSDVMAEARVASLNVRPELSAQPPYWPPILSLDAIDTYRDPGVVIEILDAQDKIRYRSGSDISTTIPISTNAFKTTLNGQTTWYTANVSGERVRVEVLPIHASTEETIANTSGKTYNGSNTNISPTRNEPVVGVLLVAKSLDDVDDTFSMLRTLLLLSGLTILVGVLLGGWIIASRVLHPLAEIVETARTIATATTRGSRFTMPSQRVRRPRGNDEMVQVVDTFNEMLDSLERLTQTQRRFVADASHELRVPLTTIQGNHRFLQLYQAEITSEERQSVLTEVNEETVRLSRLVQDLLLLARADASETTLAVPEQMESLSKGSTHQSPLELDRVVLELVRKLRRRLSVEGSMLKLEIGHIEPVRVRGDEENVRRVTLILLDNAIKYTPTSYDEGTVARVTISLKQMDRMAVLCVRDSGIGIDPADLPHIFERFYRANRARPRQGTGLGLSIAQTLVEQLGGYIAAESIPGKGSTFKVWLPLLGDL